MENCKIIKSFHFIDKDTISLNYHDGASIQLDLPKWITNDQNDINEYTDMVRLWLKEEGYSFSDKPPVVPVAKRPYNRHQKFDLTPASKIVLVPAHKEIVGPRKYTLYKLIWTKDMRPIYKITEKGFETSEKKKPILFTKEDVDMVGNFRDFITEEVIVERTKKPYSIFKKRMAREENKKKGGER